MYSPDYFQVSVRGKQPYIYLDGYNLFYVISNLKSGMRQNTSQNVFELTTEMLLLTGKSPIIRETYKLKRNRHAKYMNFLKAL